MQVERKDNHPDDYFLEKINQVENKVNLLLEAIPHRQYKTIKDIHVEMGWSISYIKKNPWTMPNYGRSDFPGREKRWFIETYNEWFSVPPVEREREWILKPFREKQRLAI